MHYVVNELHLPCNLLKISNTIRTYSLIQLLLEIFPVYNLAS